MQRKTAPHQNLVGIKARELHAGRMQWSEDLIPIRQNQTNAAIRNCSAHHTGEGFGSGAVSQTMNCARRAGVLGKSNFASHWK